MDHKGREVLVTLPSFNISVDLEKIEAQTVPVAPSKELKKAELLKEFNVQNIISDIVKNDKKTIVSGIRVNYLKKNGDKDDDNKK